MKNVIWKPSLTLTAVIICSVLSACGSNKPQTLGALSYKPQQNDAASIPKVEVKPLTHQQVREEYKALLDLFEEQELKEKIERRIADVHMMEGVQRQNTSDANSGYYSEATKAYRDILKKYPNSPDNAEVLYQLSKAYDIEGQQEEALKTLTELANRYPSYINIAEALFRKGDIHFSNQQYRESRDAYSQVVASGNQNLLLNAHYMLGWSRYKLLDYREGVDSFTFVLNTLLKDGGDLSSLSEKEAPLVDDSISSISLALDKIGGAAEISSFPRLARQEYVWRVYDNLGDYYLSKELYEQSALTFRLYVTDYQYSNKAPSLNVKLIDAYLSGGFSAQSLIEKEKYIAAYGLESKYTQVKNGISPEIQTYLKSYISELAGHFHSKGQLHQKQITELNVKRQLKLDSEEVLSVRQESIESFSKAADFYSQYIATFPSDNRVDELTFLKAETLFSSYQYPSAIKEYDKVAYAPLLSELNENTVNAGYASIISHEKQIEFLSTGRSYLGQKSNKVYGEETPEIKTWKESAVNSMLAFAEKFHADERSPAVLTNAAEYLFGLDRYRDAIEVSSNLIAKNVALDKTLKKTAYGIIALSHFKLEEYQLAQDNYLNQRLLTEQGTQEYKDITERLAASIYKKSETLIAGGENIAAIDQLLSMKQITPSSPIRITAQYDAATLLLEAKLWSRAITELLELQKNYPTYEYAVEYQRKLAFAYENNKEWNNAARAYVILVNSDPDSKIRKEALFLAANMYKNDNNLLASNIHFENYIKQYPEPFDNFMEAHFSLASNNEVLGNQRAFNKWLAAIISANQQAGAKQTDRSQWLAAWANAKYGDYYASLFHKAKLSLPIVKSAPNKNQWLQKASTSYEAAADSGLLEFVAMSSYKIGILYSDFANALRLAPKPSELSAEDKIVYASIIEEQALPFDELARSLHQANIDRAWSGQFNEWIDNSFVSMRTLSPERFDKVEKIVSRGNGIY